MNDSAGSIAQLGEGNAQPATSASIDHDSGIAVLPGSWPSPPGSRRGSRQGATWQTRSGGTISRPGLSTSNPTHSYLELRLDADPRWTVDTHQPLRMGLRDIGILFALHQYRYLDREHLERLFFSGRRRAQLKLRALQGQGLVAGWRSFSQPGLYPLPSVYVLAPAGARLLARVSESDPRRLIDQARHARSRTFHIQHDLEANGFFVDLASAARDLSDEGLYHWAGEARCRVVAAQERMATSDGWGRYLMPDREILFDLEWDRGTENDRRLAKKAKAHVAYFRGRRGASRRHVLFVAPTERREIELIRVLTGALPITGECCSFATTAASLLEYAGALGRVWHRIGSKEIGRIAFNELPGVERSDRPVEDCIGKPGWWERRRRGGEGA